MEQLRDMAERKLRETAQWKDNPTPTIGAVTYHRERNLILIDTGLPNYTYEIDMQRCRTNDEILKWIMHIVVGKNWATPELAKDLILMLERVAYKWE